MKLALNPVDIIRTKRDGATLVPDQINWFLRHYVTGEGVGDEQAAAMAMAIYFQGLDDDELLAWTRAMIDSGTRLDLGALRGRSVDKHSTGGVGDKVSLILVPLVVACGAIVPQLSGRGLGHTGGTLDKMEAIPGWRSQLSQREILNQLATVGGVIAGASDDLAPADRKLYQLRDVTATVESIPLIASSIMAKKIAEGTSALVLDVKTGSGAFMQDPQRARLLAQTMVDLGAANGVRTRALVTDMENVLGRAVGNILEVREAVEVLSGGGPVDVTELVVALATEMLDLVAIDADPRTVLASGQALGVFQRLVAAQGGDLDHALPSAKHRRPVCAAASGFVTRIDARAVGLAAWGLGAGRTSKDDPVSATAGVWSLVNVGDEVVAGQEVLELHADTEERLDTARATAQKAIEVEDRPPEARPLVIDRILPRSR